MSETNETGVAALNFSRSFFSPSRLGAPESTPVKAMRAPRRPSPWKKSPSSPGTRWETRSWSPSVSMRCTCCSSRPSSMGLRGGIVSPLSSSSRLDRLQERGDAFEQLLDLGLDLVERREPRDHVGHLQDVVDGAGFGRQQALGRGQDALDLGGEFRNLVEAWNVLHVELVDRRLQFA